MKKICTVVGARPQFIKLAVVSRELRKQFQEVIIHTGQHYDYNMSDTFFRELDIPHPDYNLGISGGTHGRMTGQMLVKIEEVFIKEHPDMVLVFGDTNSTLAAALAAVKLMIPVCHVEAGNRLGTLSNPEEINRIITDHVSSLLLSCTQSGIRFLEKEGIIDNVFFIGDPMYDAFEYYSKKIGNNQPEKIYDLEGKELRLPDRYYYMTCHRQENTDDDNKLLNILLAMDSLEYKTIYPVHPRAYDGVKRLKASNHFNNVIFCEPVGYLMSIFLTKHSIKIVTDSGGLQREAFFAKKQCVTVFDYIGWPETMIDNRNQLAKPEKNDILNKINKEQVIHKNKNPFGDGRSALKIVKHIREFLSV